MPGAPPGWPEAGAAGSGRCPRTGTTPPFPSANLVACVPSAGLPVPQACLWGLQSQYLPVFESNYSLVTGFRDVWIPVSALTLSSSLTLGKWLGFFELPLGGQLVTIMLPRKVFFFFFGCAWSSLLHGPFFSSKQGPLYMWWAGLPLRREASHGFSGCRARALGHAGSSDCGSWALEHRLGSCGTRA